MDNVSFLVEKFENNKNALLNRNNLEIQNLKKQIKLKQNNSHAIETLFVKKPKSGEKIKEGPG